MFETTSQSTLNDSIVDDSRLFNLFGGVRDSFLVQPLWFSTNHGVDPPFAPTANP